MSRIVITEFMGEAAVASLKARYSVHHDPKLYAKPDELARLLADVPALIVRNQTQVRGPVLEAAKALKVVGRLGVGLDNLDMEACTARGIRVFPATGANSLSVVEYVIGTMMTLMRGAYFANAAMLAGEFPKTKLIGREIAGKLMGLVGFGGIARGGIMDEAALVAALKADKLGGAAIDVYEQEPLGKDAAKVFAGTPNLILTPHIAGNTVESNGRVSGLVAERVMAALDGRI